MSSRPASADDGAVIRTPRLSLVLLEMPVLEAAEGPTSEERSLDWPADWPAGWPEGEDRANLAWFRKRLERFGRTPWGPRAIIDASGAMVGHTGFHAPPSSILDLLHDDATFEGDPGAPGSAVEIGYSVFAGARRQGYAVEAASALVSWAFASGAVDAVIASVAVTNAASLGVLERVGGFTAIGRCFDEEDGEERVFRRDRGGSA